MFSYFFCVRQLSARITVGYICCCLLSLLLLSHRCCFRTMQTSSVAARLHCAKQSLSDRGHSAPHIHTVTIAQLPRTHPSHVRLSKVRVLQNSVSASLLRLCLSTQRICLSVGRTSTGLITQSAGLCSGLCSSSPTSQCAHCLWTQGRIRIRFRGRAIHSSGRGRVRVPD